MKSFKDTKFGDMTGQTYTKGDDINISSMELESLDGSPLKLLIKEQTSFICKNNLIKDLNGSPQSLGGYFRCSNNKYLESLEGGPKNSGDLFDCKKCPKLKNVKEQIIKYRIKATEYETDEGYFTFESIKDDFDLYELKSKVKSSGFRTLLGLKK